MQKSAHRSSSNRWALLQYVQLFFRDFQHHSGAKLEAVLKNQAISYRLTLADTIRVLFKQFFLLICLGCPKLFFVPTVFCEMSLLLLIRYVTFFGTL